MQNSKPILFMAISTLSFALMNIFVKQMDGYSVFQLVFFRSIGSLIMSLGYLKLHNIAILGNQRGLLLARALVGVCSMGLFFMGIQSMPVGTAVSLRNLSPIFAAVFALLFLKEKIYAIQFVLFLVAFSGVLLIKGFDIRVSTVGVCYVLGSALLGGLVYILINRIGTGDHPLVVVNYLMLTATIIGGICSYFYWKHPQGTDWIMLLSTGFFGFFGQVFMTKAFRSSETNVIAPFKYLEVLFALLIGYLWLGELQSHWSLIGIGLIITALTVNVWYKQHKANVVR